ncbi:hypothetical protein CMUST_15910 (plasmid) [Corynebacterium mustelae]|nr:hypothetical protein CMUST_15910 [Corynebacterium mustelae]
MVIALCRSYGRSPITGLIENGYIHEHETDGIGIEYALRKATNQQILDEILKRSDPEARLLFTNDADPNVIDLAEGPVEFNPASVTHIDDLSHVRGSRYAADRRMREPQEGDDDYGSGA